VSDNKHDATEKAGEALERLAQEFTKHSGPSSEYRERDTFSRDLRAGALRYARAYYAEARDLGLIPEYERIDRVCAVVGCPNPGKPQICPGDGASHGHGRVHYRDCHSTLTFRDGEWHLVCDAHLAELRAARIEWEETRREQRKADLADHNAEGK
jgi:hypothetical protein